MGNINIPDSALFQAGAGPDLKLTHDGTNSTISNATGTLTINNIPDASLIIGTQNSTRVTITGDGDVGIGTSTIANESDHNKLKISGASGTGAGIIEFADGSNNIDGAIFSDGGNLFIVADRDNATADSSIRFRVDGSSEKMRITSGGNVGIGVTDPDNKGEIVGGSDAPLTLKTADTRNGIFIKKPGTDTIMGSVLLLADESFRLGTESVYNMTMLQNGNIGIGYDSPSQILTVAGATGASLGLFRNDADSAIVNGNHLGQIEFSGKDTGGERTGAMIRATTTGSWDTDTDHNPTRLDFFTEDGSSTGNLGTPRMTIQENGHIGIGETAPSYELDVRNVGSDVTVQAKASSGVAYFRADSGASTNAGLQILENGVTRWGIFNDGDNSDKLTFEDQDGHINMTIQQDGKVGIGVTDPECVLELKGSSTGKKLFVVHSSSTDSDCYGQEIKFDSADPDNESQYFLSCEDSASARFRIYSSGDTWSADGGAVNSDERLKENIVDASSKLDDINKLKVRNFNWRETDSETGKTIHKGDTSSKKRIGFIAQELETVFPALVQEYDQDTEGKGEVMRKGIKHTALIPILVKAVQELSAKVEALENG